VQPGGAGTFRIRLDSKVNINSDVSFTLSGSQPSNSTWTFVPQRMASTARDAELVVQTTSQTPVGSYPLTIVADEIGYGSDNESIRLDVVGPGDAADFALELDPADITLAPNASGPTVTFRVRALNGFAGTVNIFIDGIEAPPAPVVIASPLTPSQLTFASGETGKGGAFVPALAQRSSYPPTWTLTVRAVSGTLSHTRTLNIRINAP